MVDISLVIVLALVSSTVVAQPGTNGFTGLFACFKRLTTFKTSTKSVYEWVPSSKGTSTSTSDEDPVDIGLSYILQKLNIQPDEFTIRNNFTDRFWATHLYGILTKRSPAIPDSTFKISSRKAVKTAVNCLGVPFYNDIAPVMEYYETSDEHIPVWVFQLRDDPTTQWIEVKVNANTGGIVSMEDFKKKFTYTAIKLPNESPHDGFSTIVNPENIQSSSNGWTDGFELAGNNALIRFESGVTFETTTRGIFDMDFDHILPPQTPKNLVAGAINAFYVTNAFHDTLYQHGFTEKAGNFQRDNFKRGGKGGDPVMINVQNSGMTNNARFFAPPDGQPGVLDLYIFTATEPNRDPDLDNTILIHELTHGLTTRLTGGAQTKKCMMKTESRGLGEGYSDMMALIFTAKPEDTRNTKKVIGEYIEGDPRGGRRYPYTTDMRVNPLEYQDTVGEKNPYHLGEIWATMLLEVYWNLVDAYGFSANLHDATQKKG
ncbi:hypothetical protein BASA83_009260 [Batrachochytrium salamandrivorans]|nr:hypothetical protein BASA83_009260 [Batrachochytrium salamandrivorans]